MLSPENRPADFPKRLAIVIGRESDGVSAEMLDAADKRVFIPMFGFTEVGKSWWSGCSCVHNHNVCSVFQLVGGDCTDCPAGD
jgi:hypothetical protein